MIKMPKEMKQRWVEALHSGKYKQAQGALEKEGGYCCLGVLQMVVDGQVETYVRHDKWGNRHENPASMPSRKWCERNKIEHDGWQVVIDDVEDAYGNVDSYSDLPELNDESPLTFRDIAGVIEQQVEGV